MTKRLGIRYLWIDALCVIQVSEQDWMGNALKMDYIYAMPFLKLQRHLQLLARMECSPVTYNTGNFVQN
jgi:hypothetical protein